MISSFHFTEGSFGYKASDDQLSDYAVTLSDYAATLSHYGLAECPIGRLCFISGYVLYIVYFLWYIFYGKIAVQNTKKCSVLYSL